MIKKKESWLKAAWRPALAWSYVVICLFDFIIGPIIYNMLQFYNPGQDVAMWQAITLQGGGLYHLSMGAIIGISSHGRTQEKLKGVQEHVMPSFGGGMMSSYSTNPVASSYAPNVVPTAPVGNNINEGVSIGKFGAAPIQPAHPLL